jgi:hypothetical protein
LIISPYQDRLVAPSFEMGNIARHAGESLYPHLWTNLTGCYDADAGVQGMKLINFSHAPVVATTSHLGGEFSSVTNTSKWVPGRRGPALQYDGTANTEISLGYSLLNLNLSFTLAAWVNLGVAAGNTKSIIGAAIKGFEGSRSYFILIHRADKNGVVLQYQLTGSPAVFTANPSKNLTVGKWQHICCVRDRTLGNIRIYQDGEQVSSTATNPSFTNFDTQRYGLGCWNPFSGGNYFNGQISSGYLWQRPLQEIEIRQLAMGATPLQMNV